MNTKKIYKAVLSGEKDNNMRFSDIQKLLAAFDLQCRIKGDHFIYGSIKYNDILNIQPDNGMAKSYQVRQIRNFIRKNGIKLK